MVEYSSYQLAIVNDVNDGKGNTAINAVAGSGKTFIICEAARPIPRIYNVLMSAFGADIAKNLRTKELPRNVKILTYNAMGWGIANNCTPGGRLVLQEDKNDQILQHMVLGAKEEDQESWKKYQRLKGATKRLVSLMKGECIYDTSLAPARIEELVAYHAMEVPEDRDFVQVVCDTYEKSIKNELVYDYDDQIFQVLRQNMPVMAYDYTFVDEFQDTNEMQFRLMREASRMGRFFGIGDPDQAIYGFRGSTPNAFRRFIQDFEAKELPLSITYRCPKLVVAEAKKIVPRIEAASWARDGVVDTISTDDFKRRARPGDYVLCRTIAPLIKRCLENIRDGVPAYVLGRDIGEDLEYLIDKVTGRSYFMSIKQFNELLGEYVTKKMNAYAALKKEALAIALEDKHQTLLYLMEGCSDVSGLIQHIRKVFSDSKNRHAIMYMSMHKSKGLETEFNVWILRPDLLPHPRSTTPWQLEEERRLKYVAVTRTKNGLFWVTKERGEK